MISYILESERVMEDNQAVNSQITDRAFVTPICLNFNLDRFY